jgi:rod shape-determining protein MreD
MITNVIKWIVAFIIAFALQTTLVSAISIYGVKPDLIVIVLFMLAIKVGILPAVYVGFLIGLSQDIYSPSFLGQNALAKTVAIFFASLFNEKVMRIDPIFQAVLLVVTILISDSVFQMVQVVKSHSSIGVVGIELMTSALPRGLYSLLFGFVPIFWEHFFHAGTRR